MFKGYPCERKKLSFYKFAQLSNQLFISQLEINHVIQQPTTKKAKGYVDNVYHILVFDFIRALLSVEASNIDEQWQ